VDSLGRPLADKGRRERGMVTINGEVRLERRRYHGPEEGTITPVDTLAELAQATVSLGVRELACRLNAGAKSFDKAAENLRRAAQVPLSREKLRQVVEAEGQKAQAASAQGRLEVGWQAQECQTETGVARVYTSTDGFTAPLVTDAEKRKRRKQVRQARRRRGKKARPLGTLRKGARQRYQEFKAVMFYDQTMDHRLVSVTRGNCQVLGRMMKRDADRIGFYGAGERIGNIDGGPWARNQVQRRLKVTALGLDFYHLSQNAHQARRVIFGEEDKAGEALVGQWLHTVKHQGYEALWEELSQHRRLLRSKSKRQALDRFMHYVSDRRDMIQYPQFLAQGWQIGSGPMESQCRVVPDRVKGPGKRWDADHAEEVMALEALDQSNLWPAYWRLALSTLN
jgi:hypothetical protein